MKYIYNEIFEGIKYTGDNADEVIDFLLKYSDYSEYSINKNKKIITIYMDDGAKAKLRKGETLMVHNKGAIFICCDATLEEMFTPITKEVKDEK